MNTVWNRAPLVALVLFSCAQEYEVIQGPVDVDPEDVTPCSFTAMPGTQMSVYDCNPVFTGTGEAWGDQFNSVGFRTQMVLGHPFYQIWYTAQPEGVEEGQYGLGYAISTDGTTWEPHPDNPLIADNRGWDKTNMDAIQVVWDDTLEEYSLWYQGYNLNTSEWGMGIQTSNDGVAWTPFNDGDKVLDLSKEFQGVSYCWPLGVTHHGADGFFGYLGGGKPADNVCQIYQFTRDTLRDGTVDIGSQPILKAGPQRYDAAGMASAAVVEFAVDGTTHDGTWYLFYVGFEEWVQQVGYQTSNHHSLNLATSTDGGKTWEKSPNNPIGVSLHPDGYVSDVAAQVVGNRIHLWITDWYEDLDQMAVGYYIFEPEISNHP